MFAHMNNCGVEDICFEKEHVQKVLAAIKKSFESYFTNYLESAAGKSVTDTSFTELQKRFKVSISATNKRSNLSDNFKTIITEAYDDFEKDQDAYITIFDEELLEDYDEDTDSFKSKVLRNECPIIRKTLANRQAKELDKYRASFSLSDPDHLLNVVYNLCVFGNEYKGNYDPDTYENIQTYQELGMAPLDTDEYTAYGVIGGGIKTHMLYKVHPDLFPNRSRSAIWALWYLTEKQTFGCKTDSEFLMIDVKKSTTQQNYFYPYELFAFYAFRIYKLLRDKATEYGAYIDPSYRYVVVDSFLDYIASEHDSEISLLKSQISDGGMGYA